jgi:hypothetical protein
MWRCEDVVLDGFRRARRELLFLGLQGETELLYLNDSQQKSPLALFTSSCEGLYLHVLSLQLYAQMAPFFH